jgi:hypothetical protein
MVSGFGLLKLRHPLLVGSAWNLILNILVTPHIASAAGGVTGFIGGEESQPVSLSNQNDFCGPNDAAAIIAA